MTYSIQQTKSGKPTLVREEGGRVIRLHSAVDPVSEAAKLAEAFSEGRASHIAVLGLGLGYHVQALRKKYPDAVILIFESSPQVAKLAKEHNPDCLKNASLILGEEELSAFFDEFNISDFKGIAPFIHASSHRLAPEFYDSMLSAAKEQISSRISDMLTRFEFQEKWIENIFANVPQLPSALPVRKFFGRFKGYAGVIVSAGPSLRKNVRQLAALKDKALLVCVDTAYKVCLKSGVVPHIVMTIDAQRHSVKHFLGADANALLLADIVSCPAILRGYEGRKAVSTTSKYFTTQAGKTIRETTPAMDWLEKRVEPIGDVQSGGSVATSAFDFLLNAGCDPIILVGQDLAYTGREIHSAGTHHNDDWLPTCTRLKNLDTINQGVIRRRSIKQAAGWGGGVALTDFVLDLYRGWFRDAAATSGLTVINATEGGAHIEGARENTLAEAAAALPKVKCSPAAILADVTGCIDIKNASEEFARAEAALRRFCGLAQTEPDIRRLEAAAEAEDIAALLEPLMRKTCFYAERRGLTPAEAARVIAADAEQAGAKLAAMLARAYSLM